MENQENQNRNQNKFNINYRIGFDGLSSDKSLSLPGLMKCVQEASLFHTFAIPGAFEYYDKMNWVWVITHWQVEIAAYPKLGDKINISTWPVRFKGYFGERGYEVQDAAGASMLAANSNWILLNRNTYGPVRPTNFICEKYGECYPFLLEKDFSMPKAEGFTPLSVHDYTPTRRDIDTNDHVNNVKYLEWVYNHIPENIYRNYRAKSLKVAYKKETLLGDNLKIALSHRQQGDDIEIVAIIEKSGAVATEIYILCQVVE